MSDLIDRQAAIEALKNDMASLDHIIKGMSANDVRLDAYVSQRNQVNYDIYTINNLPPVQPEQLSTNLAEVGTDCISRQQAIEALRAMQTYKLFAGDDMLLIDQAGAQTELMLLPSAQPEIVRCKDCKNWGDDDCPMRFIEQVEYDDDGYIEHDDIIHDYTKDDGFCDRAERREVTT